MSFDVIPAIDLRGGRVVRLRQGDYARETQFPDDPVALAERYANAGARWVHIVDLDAARSGTFANVSVLESICHTGTLHVQAGGGVRSADDVERLLAAGVERVVIGSIAVANPEVATQWITRYGAERVVLALDARDVDGTWRLPVRGWTLDSGRTLDAVLTHYAANGARYILCTDIGRDGTLGGIDAALYRHLHALVPDCAIQASGGATALDDVRAARAAGAGAIVLGRALLEGHIDLQAALAC
ncbi:MAG TPA: 1-(5-phosphoribosyl)-5-[(5-phosphoribosylamino)methylideneamino]imidazole-4-carboxamide isomerase [Rhodanobacteraceae bacterium]